jgi:hypothetical protein
LRHGDATVVKPGYGQLGRDAELLGVPEGQECSIAGCIRAKHTRGWCQLHYKRFLRNGDPTALDEWNDDKPCGVDGCTDKHRIQGYCYKHYSRFRKHGDPVAGRRDAVPAIDHEDGDRTCNRCFEKKPITAYHVAPLGARGRHTECGDCSRVEAKARIASNPAYYDDMARTARHQRRAKIYEQGYEVGITRAKLRERLGDDCIYCSATMDFTSRGRTYVPKRATIEHVLPISRGGSHTWDNLALCCLECNCSKGDKTVTEWEQWKLDVAEMAA